MDSYTREQEIIIANTGFYTVYTGARNGNTNLIRNESVFLGSNGPVAYAHVFLLKGEKLKFSYSDINGDAYLSIVELDGSFQVIGKYSYTP